MAFQILKMTLVLLAVFLPVVSARILFRKQFGRWFEVKETSYFSMGFPITLQGYLLSAGLIAVVIVLLILINVYV
jgi:hypothetical protein